MLKSEGYKMFRGKADIVAVNPKFSKSDVYGDWLYKPEYDCWYVNGSSYPAEIVKNIREDGEEIGDKLMSLQTYRFAADTPIMVERNEVLGVLEGVLK